MSLLSHTPSPSTATDEVLISDAAGPLTVADVMAVEAGPPRDKAIMRWCASVWTAWSSEHERVRAMVDRFL